MWNCVCDCGTSRPVSGIALRNGTSKSCGCFHRDIVTKHKCSTVKTPEYQSWSSMISRCYRVKATAYSSYGGRGISVCDRWRFSFTNFLTDMGPRPSKMHTLDRIDNNGNYEPSNCRWATKLQQVVNRRPCKNKTGFPGVKKDNRCPKNRYVAKIQIRGKTISLGYYTTPEQAAEAYLKAKTKIKEEISA